MSYPYLGDLLNALFGTNLYIPIATFGGMVAIAIIVASTIAKKEVIRCENLGILPQTIPNSSPSIPTHQLVSGLTMVCAFSGIFGARLFHILEYPTEFLADPLAMIFSRQGLSIYGGLIVGAIGGAVFLRKRGIPLLSMLDAVAPAVALGYGIGRIGCQISGDGDWGKTANMALKPDWLPDWFWAQTYENNIAGVLIQSPGVYPTPLYEILMATCIFIFLWSIRKTKYSQGYMFSMYLLLSGFARLLIEKIRINSEYHFLQMSFTQAEFISIVLIGAGLIGILKTTRSNAFSKIGISLVVVAALSACTKL